MDQGAFRAQRRAGADGLRGRRGPNGPKIEKETTHHLLSWKRRASTA